MYINDIKKKIDEILSNDFEISVGFPRIELDQNKYKKTWISSILVTLPDFNTFFVQNKDDQKTLISTIKSFQEGIIEIIKNYKIDNVDIFRDKIFVYSRSDRQNSEISRRIFNCAMEINGFLKYYWNRLDYKICVSLAEEIFYFVNNETELQYLGIALNKAETLAQKSRIKNQILLDKLFVVNNSEILTKDDSSSYYQENIDGELFSTYCCVDWKND